MAQENSGMDLPVIVGAVVVGLIAVVVFYFTKAEPVIPAAPVVPSKQMPTVTATAPVMKDTQGTVNGNVASAASSGGGGGNTGGTNDPRVNVRRPVVAGGPGG